MNVEAASLFWPLINILSHPDEAAPPQSFPQEGVASSLRVTVALSAEHQQHCIETSADRSTMQHQDG